MSERRAGVVVVEGGGDQPQGLVGRVKEGDVFEAALDLAPLPPLRCAGAAYVVVEGEVLQGQQQRGVPTAARGAPFRELLQDEQVAGLRVSREMLEVFPELVEHDHDRGVLGKRIEELPEAAGGWLGERPQRSGADGRGRPALPSGSDRRVEGAQDGTGSRFGLRGRYGPQKAGLTRVKIVPPRGDLACKVRVD